MGILNPFQLRIMLNSGLQEQSYYNMSINRAKPGLQPQQAPNTPFVSSVASSSQQFVEQVPIKPSASQLPSYLYEPQPLIQQAPVYSFQNQSNPFSVYQPINEPPVLPNQNYNSNLSFSYFPEVQQQQSFGYANSVPKQSLFNQGYNNQPLPYNPSLFKPVQFPYDSSPQQQPMAQNMNIYPNIRLLKEKQKDKAVVAIIVTFSNEMSFDNLFSTVQQKTLEGTQVIVYACNSQAIIPLMKAFKGEEIFTNYKEDQTPKLAKEVVNYTKEVDPDCVVFNWECSMGYTCEYFTDKAELMEFLGLLLSKGFMTMFSDFSLKALINDWDQSVLGKNPFKRTGTTLGQATLKFKPSVLKECPSSQLQLLADLTEGGKCTIHCASNTILYSVDKDSIDNQKYTLEMLTIHLTSEQLPPNLRHEIDGEFGDAGHVLLRYKSGGMLLTSMGHWIELMKIDPSEKKLFEVAEREYGVAYAQAMKAEYNQMNGSMKQQYLSSNAVQFVQNQAPCSNMNRKSYN